MYIGFICQFALSTCLIWEFFDDVNGTYDIKNDYFKLYLAKFITTFAMHMLIAADFLPALRLLKYLVYHPHKFTHPQMARSLIFL